MHEEGTWIPITDEQAKLGQEVVKAFSGLGTFLGDALGSTPKDLIGYLGGDWLRLRRAENIAEMMARTRKQLDVWGVKAPEPSSLSLALPILRGAADESREELQDLWARLMAATLAPSRAGSVRQGFAEAISKMDPVDALVMELFKTEVLIEQAHESTTNNRGTSARKLGISLDELETSIWNLTKLELIQNINAVTIGASPFGREFLRVVTS